LRWRTALFQCTRWYDLSEVPIDTVALTSTT
jgi:cytochrome c oxidase assembly protein Cox11